MNNFWKQLLQADYSIEYGINKLWINPFFDLTMPIFREPLTWLPLYVVIAFLLVHKFKWQGFYMLLIALLAVLFCDTLAAQVIKPSVARLRPCFDTSIQSSVRMLVSCGGRYSFPSNHAANHFALSTFLFLAIKKIADKKWLWLFVWATIVCYAQVYVGKHFPLDIFCGAALGTIAGVLFFMLWKNTLLQLRYSRSKFPFINKNQKERNGPMYG